LNKRWENAGSNVMTRIADRFRERIDTGLGNMNGQNILLEQSLGGKPNEQPVATRPLALWKRALDIGLIFLFLPGLLIVGTVVSLIVKFGSRGPILFRRKRVGYKGR